VADVVTGVGIEQLAVGFDRVGQVTER